MAEFYLFEDDGFCAQQAKELLSEAGHTVPVHVASIQAGFEVLDEILRSGTAPDGLLLDGTLRDNESTPKFEYHHEGEFVNEIIMRRKFLRKKPQTVEVPRVSTFLIDYRRDQAHARVVSNIIKTLDIPTKIIGYAGTPLARDIRVDYDSEKRPMLLREALSSLFPPQK